MTKTVLIIMPQFVPSSYPPANRVRLFCNHLEKFGWQPVVLTVEPRFLEEEPDWDFARLVPAGLEVVRTKALPVRWTRRLGIGDLGIRSFFFQMAAARKLCRERKIDLLFIPGPPWHTFLVGPRIKKEFGIPYVMDYIDPWVMSLGENDPPWTKAYWFRKMALFLEPFAVRDVDHIVAVSDGTNEGVRKRYSFLAPQKCSGIPYGGEPADFDFVAGKPGGNPFFAPGDGFFHFVYMGAMLPKGYDTLRALFQALRQIREKAPDHYRRLRLHFIGTTYAANPEKGLVVPVAEEMGVGDIVSEYPRRIPYLDAVTVQSQADANLVLGTTETHYTASKIYPCIMAKKPILAIFHGASSVVRVMRSTNAGELIAHDSQETVDCRVDEIRNTIIRMISPAYTKPETDWGAFERYTSATMTGQLAAIFDTLVWNRGSAN